MCQYNWSTLPQLFSSTYLSLIILLVLVILLMASSARFKQFFRSSTNLVFLFSMAILLIVIVVAQAYLAYFDSLGPYSEERPEWVEVLGALSISGHALIFAMVSLWCSGLAILIARRSTVPEVPVGSSIFWLLGPLLMLLLTSSALVLSFLGVPPIAGVSLFRQIGTEGLADVLLDSSPLLGFSCSLGILLLLLAIARTFFRSRILSIILDSGCLTFVTFMAFSGLQAFESIDFFDPIPDRSLAISLGLFLTTVLIATFMSWFLLGLYWIRCNLPRSRFHS